MSYGWTGERTGITPKARQAALKRDHHACRTCGAPATEIDHITNVAQGGTHAPDNLQALCTPCHRAKTEREALAARKAAYAAARHPAEKHPGIR